MIRSILVPLDGSEFGEHALPMALNIARRAEAVVHLVHVHQIVPPTSVAGVAVMDAIDLHLRQDEMAYLADVMRRIAEAKPVMVKTALLEGEVVPSIKEYADANEIDLVVMSTHGRGAFSRFWLGSVADELVSELKQPVILIRPEEGKPDLRKEIDLRTILVPSDGHVSSEMVLDPATDLAKLFGSTIDLLRVVKPVLRPAYTPGGFFEGVLTNQELEEIRAAQEKLENRAKIYLDEVRNELEEEGLQAETHVVVNEEPAKGITAQAKQRHADLIAMETHARRGLSRLFLGSVADKIVRGGVAPVLLHHTVK